ncbi:hypothetical protein M406DRAFT_354122 [Cryphonectria parasitica EP155]|uniref:N-acetyltransferase domain-containing protein n=1 Tax=Cryphonectria parasitica (strain ATCC 38755 / EP155) TaxID=660469 RepID=A0A9P4YBQ8_CRYP1|nr:uncharacterized protein M406DRAFT_354122 [Cryphonectria parasitica EP155]KAF3769740.1 hypothetical protein M406DRAFT_354122 [Cryphonectria parasitica EP155]
MHAGKHPTFYYPIETPLSNDRVKLIPFDVDLHSAAFVDQSKDYPQLFAHMPSGPFQTVGAWKSRFEDPSSFFSPTNPSSFVFAIIDTTRSPSPEDEDGELAGVVLYMNTSKPHRSTEIGFIVVLPNYQRTHVATNTVGLLMQCAFGSPDEGGLGLVRVEWKTSTANIPSARLAEKIGYSKVGVIPYHYCFALGKRTEKVSNGKPLPPGSDPDDLWRDTVVYSMSWDQWETAKGKVEEMMAR